MSRFLELIQFARENSPYYKSLYKDIPFEEDILSNYPIIEQNKFWNANENLGEGLLTEVYKSGVVFKSGGTSGNPKYSYFNAHEWKSFIDVSAHGFKQNGIQEGDRIANLFYAGGLYASFIYISDTIESANVGINFPIGGQSSIEDMVTIIKKHNINVIAGVPTTVMNIIAYIQEKSIKGVNLELILFGGEALYEDQKLLIQKQWSGVKINSILFASVDGGELGYFDAKTCENGEHRSFDESTIMEIVDEESGEVIEEIDRIGRLLVTNLARHLMPLIRYPVGDMASWCEPSGIKDRKFKLQGRSQEGARVGPVTLYIEDLISTFEHFKEIFLVLNFQVVLSHFEQKDKATIKIALQDLKVCTKELTANVIAHIYTKRKMLKELAEGNIIHPLEIEWCSVDSLESNKRTGKTKKVLDKRLEKR